MRRLALMALVVGATVVAGPGTASAHVCTLAVEIPVGRPDTVAVGITVEATPVTDVEVDVPAGLRLDRVDPQAGWKIIRTGSTLRYRGGPIAAYSCQYFTLLLTAPVSGSWRLPVVQRAADGTVVTRTSPDLTKPLNPFVEQTVYAGETPPAPPGQGGGMSATAWLGIALVAVAVALMGTVGWRTWRAGRDEYEDLDDEEFDAAMRELELQERLEQFKKQTRRRPAPH